MFATILRIVSPGSSHCGCVRAGSGTSGRSSMWQNTLTGWATRTSSFGRWGYSPLPFFLVLNICTGLQRYKCFDFRFMIFTSPIITSGNKDPISQQAYTWRERVSTPAFVEPIQAELLNCGKLINLLKQCTPDVSYPRNQGYTSGFNQSPFVLRFN